MNNKKLATSFMILSIVFLIAACSNKHVSTNLDKDNFTHYFSPATVKIYEQESEIETQYKYIGIVEGQDCQTKPHHAAPDKINARTKARHQAFKLQANGVIFTRCALLTPEKLAKLNESSDAQHCNAIIICYAKAFAVEPPTKN